MNEAQWLACTNPVEMLSEVGLENGPRKVRLFVCACLRRLWAKLPNYASHRQVEMAERFADGLVTKSDLAVARGTGQPPSAFLAAAAWYAAADPVDLPFRALHVLDNIKAALRKAERERELPALAELARDIFNLDGSLKMNPAWLRWQDGMIPKMAASIYEARRFDELPMLADALEEAGCENRDLLDHLRGPGPHVAGCRMLDSILGLSG